MRGDQKGADTNNSGDVWPLAVNPDSLKNRNLLAVDRAVDLDLAQRDGYQVALPTHKMAACDCAIGIGKSGTKKGVVGARIQAIGLLWSADDRTARNFV